MIKKRFFKIKPEVWLILILIFALFMRIFFFTGPCCDDDVAYLDNARNILNLNFNGFRFEDSFAYRTMMTLPIAISFKTLGISEFSASLYILLASLGSIIVAFFIGKSLFNERVGLFAALLLAFFPLEVIYSTHIVPDIPLAFFIGLSILIFIYAEKHNKNKFFIVSGVVTGLAYLVKVTALVVLPFILLYAVFFLKKNKIRTILKYLLGFLLIFLIESCYTYYLTGSILTSYKAYVTGQEAWGMFKERTEAEIKSELMFYPSMMFGNGIFTGVSDYYGYFFLLFVFAALVSLKHTKYRKQLKIILLWFLSIFLYLQFGTMDVRSFVLIHRLARFATLLSIPLAITIAHFLDAITLKKSVIVALTVLAIFLLPLFLDSLARIQRVTNYDNNQVLGDVRELGRVLKTLPNKDIYFYKDTREFGLLKFYFDFNEDGRLKLLFDKPCESISGAYVVIDDNLSYFEGQPYSNCLRNPPQNWQLISVITKADQGTYGMFDPKIYYAP